MQKLIGKTFGRLRVLEYTGNSKYQCQCLCGSTKIVRKYDLENGKTASCGCARMIPPNTVYGEWMVLEYIGNRKYRCQCSCGEIKEIYGNSLKSGESKSCGHKNPNQIDLVNQVFGEWKVLEYVGESKFKCQCSCGEIRDIRSISLRRGWSKSCGHNTNRLRDLANKTFGELKVLNYLGQGIWSCQCSCGELCKVKSKNLLNGSSKHCGHLTNLARQLNSNIYRSIDQTEAVKTPENLIKFIGNDKLTFLELSILLGLTYSHTVKLCNKFGVSSLIDKIPSRSYLEDELCDFISSIIPDNTLIETNNRTLLGNNQELDIYIPDIKLAIEFNGDYWHSDLIKSNTYHQEKSLLAIKHGIKLVHIFEYEWMQFNLDIKQYLIGLITSHFGSESYKLDIDNLFISEMDISDSRFKQLAKSEYTVFGELNQLRKLNNSYNYIALHNNDEIYQVLIFDKSSNSLIGYSVKSGLGIEFIRLGLIRLYNNLIIRYKLDNLRVTINITKFSLDMLEYLGFSIIEIHDPKYIDTGALRIYDSGEITLYWKRK